MSDDQDHPVADQLLGGGDGLLGIAEVIRRDQLHRLAEDAAGGVDVGHGLSRPALQLLTEPSERAGDRACQSDQDVRPQRRGRERRN